MSDNIKKIGIVDQPNANFDSDSLNIKPHADALTNFIQRCDTPITIGIQGEWGSGKTSLLNLIENNLDGNNPQHEENAGKFLQIWVNAWEHSLLSKPEETLLKIVNQIINDMVAELDKGDSTKEQIKSKFSVLAKGALRVATSAVAGDEATKVVDELIGDNSNVITDLKDQLDSLAKTINKADKGNPAQYEKIVIYVDDLDRIDPPDAVAILELLKNIFNVKHCIFVLAIDYQVVIKGLKDKFGERTDENEWEFRAFFDKIIQLPFMMPVSQYDIGNYVEQLLEQIGFLTKDQEIHDKMETPIDEMIKEIVKLSIGGNPRALKRLVNSLSLIEIFANQKETDEDEQSTELNETEQDMLMFAIMCMQIKYPEIYEVITKHPDFRQWNDKVALEITDRREESNDFPNFEKDFQTACGISWENYVKTVRKEDKELKAKGSGARVEFDEPWERVLFILCYPNPRYRRRADDISNLLSYIDKKVLKEKSGDETSKAIRFIVNQTSVTSVTTTDDLKSDTNKKAYAPTHLEGMDVYIDQIREKTKGKHKPQEELLIGIDLAIREKFKEEIDKKDILPIVTPTGGLSLNWKKKSGGKFFQIRFGESDKFLMDKFGEKIPHKTFLRAYCYKTIKNYQYEKIEPLFPAQSMHSNWMYSFIIRDMKDWKLFMESGLMEDAIKTIDRGKRVMMYNDTSKSKLLKPYFIKDHLKILDKGYNW
tara:strand:- start:66 stop:2195 length:2130 start_codon:yes stop_codon:yes gene_type:complete